MKLKVLLLSMTMLLSMVSSSIFGIKIDDYKNKAANETEATTEEIREDASHTGEDTDTSGDKDKLDSEDNKSDSEDENESDKDNKDSDKDNKTTEEPTTQEVPSVVVPDNTDTTNDPAVDTTKGKYKITIKPEELGWFNDATNIVVEYEYLSSVLVEPKIEKVEAKAGSNGTWVDITDEMKFEISENCTVYVKITDQFENEYEKSKLIKIFDTVAPTLNAAVNEGLLTVMTYDTESGVDAVYINGYSYTPDENGIVSIRLEKFDATYQNFYVYALDKAGNPSTVYTIANPYWTDPNAETEEDGEEKEDPAESLPENATPQTTGESKAEVTSVTDEDGEDITNEVKSKQFYSIVTADGQQYFLVIDMTAAQDKSGDTESTAYAGAGSSYKNNSPNNGTVYFLTSVSNQNLLNFTNDGETTLPKNSVATANGIDPYTMTPISKGQPATEEVTEASTETDAEKEEDIKKSDKGKSGIISTLLWVGLVVLVGALVVGIKIVMGKKGKPEQSDDSMYNDSGEQEDRTSLEELNESEEE